MTDLVYLNGQFLPATEARIGIYDGGFLHGAGLFETMRADYGKVFRFDQHLDRMLGSAEKLGLPIERPDLPLTRDMDELLERNGLETARVRLTVTVGSMHPNAMSEGAPPLTVCVTATELAPYPPDMLAVGVNVMICAFAQVTTDPLAGHKTINYLARLVALRHAQKFTCAEALWFTTENFLAEGCVSNVFVVKNGALATPPLNTPVLPGVTRAVVLEIAEQNAIVAEERRLNINDVLDADEILLTNSSMLVLPVCRVEKKEIGSGKPGPMGTMLRERLLDTIRAECQAKD
jgi:branched-subunit amino acid aminotransferase/4-amino-4-deoxychorismate lyase